MFCEYMFTYCLFCFIMLFNSSSMFELHVVVPIILNILILIIEIVPKFPTTQKPNCRRFSELKMAGFTDALRPDKLSVCTLRDRSTRLSFGLSL
jgi:hypothetical protein